MTIKVCRACGYEFDGGSKARYCVECRHPLRRANGTVWRRVVAVSSDVRVVNTVEGIYELTFDEPLQFNNFCMTGTIRIEGDTASVRGARLAAWFVQMESVLKDVFTHRSAWDVDWTLFGLVPDDNLIDGVVGYRLNLMRDDQVEVFEVVRERPGMDTPKVLMSWECTNISAVRDARKVAVNNA